MKDSDQERENKIKSLNNKRKVNEKGKEEEEATEEKGKAAQKCFSLQRKNMIWEQKTVHFIVKEEWLYL